MNEYFFYAYLMTGVLWAMFKAYVRKDKVIKHFDEQSWPYLPAELFALCAVMALIAIVITWPFSVIKTIEFRK